MISTLKNNPLQPTSTTTPIDFGRRKRVSISTRMRPLMAEATSSLTYQKFVQFALQQTRKHTHLAPSSLQEKFSGLSAMDGKTELQVQAFESPKIRLLRSLSIEGSDGMQTVNISASSNLTKAKSWKEELQEREEAGNKSVLDFAIFPRAEFDLPIFCANFFTTPVINIVVLFHQKKNRNYSVGRTELVLNFDILSPVLTRDLNPLHNVISRQDYKKKYYTHLIPLGLKYGELLPWGGKITAESMKFFSPIVIWTKFPASEHKHHLLYSAFQDYLKSWLELMDHASGETDVSRIMVNLEAQHKYLTWRAEKDPGHQVLTRLVGETRAKEIIKNFLFYGVDELGSRTFIDYFPEYKCDDGTVNRKRSMVGKSFECRPWDSKGEFIGDSLR